MEKFSKEEVKDFFALSKKVEFWDEPSLSLCSISIEDGLKGENKKT